VIAKCRKHISWDLARNIDIKHPRPAVPKHGTHEPWFIVSIIGHELETTLVVIADHISKELQVNNIKTVGDVATSVLDNRTDSNETIRRRGRRNSILPVVTVPRKANGHVGKITHDIIVSSDIAGINMPHDMVPWHMNTRSVISAFDKGTGNVCADIAWPFDPWVIDEGWRKLVRRLGSATLRHHRERLIINIKLDFIEDTKNLGIASPNDIIIAGGRNPFLELHEPMAIICQQFW
jgi:hypothetical protein